MISNRVEWWRIVEQRIAGVDLSLQALTEETEYNCCPCCRRKVIVLVAVLAGYDGRVAMWIALQVVEDRGVMIKMLRM